MLVKSMLKDPNSLDHHWFAYWFFFSHSFILSVGGLFGVNQGLRPYADTCGAFEYVCTVYADADVLCRSQTVIEPCTVSEFFLYNLECCV